MLARDEHGNVLHALLIDFDYASSLENNGTADSDNGTADNGTADVKREGGDVVDRFRTVSLFPFVFPLVYLSLLKGTPPFMAIEILLQKGRRFHHCLRHDLESLFFVIIWICSHMEGPQVERNDAARLTIRKWSDLEASLQHLGHIKLGHIDDMKNAILSEITSYWDDFKDSISDLKRAFFPKCAAEPNCITPEKMVEILEAALKTVKEPANGRPLSGPSEEPTSCDVEMHEYEVLKYGKGYRRGQAEAPRKRMRVTKSSQATQATRRSPIRTRSSTRTGDSSGASGSGSNVSKPSKLRDSSTLRDFGTTV